MPYFKNCQFVRLLYTEMKKDRPRLSRAELAKLRIAMERMQPRDVLHQAIKDEMQRRGRWKVKPRGKPGWPPDNRRGRSNRIEG